jgi:ribosomal protein L29
MPKEKNTLKDKKDEELKALIQEKREELQKIRFGQTGAQSKSAQSANKLRKEIAQGLTEVRARKNK